MAVHAIESLCIGAAGAVSWLFDSKKKKKQSDLKLCFLEPDSEAEVQYLNSLLRGGVRVGVRSKACEDLGQGVRGVGLRGEGHSHDEGWAGEVRIG